MRWQATPQREAEDAAQQAVVEGGVHAGVRQPRQQQRQRDGRQQQDPVAHTDPQRNGGEHHIGPHFGADRPTRAVPGQPVMDVQAMDEKEVGEYRDGLKAAGEGRGLSGVGAAGHDPGGFPGDEAQQHEDMQGIQPTEPQHEEALDSAPRVQPRAVFPRDDEAAEHEEEIDEQVAVANQRPGVDRAVAVDVEQYHQAGADAAPAIEGLEAPGGRGR